MIKTISIQVDYNTKKVVAEVNTVEAETITLETQTELFHGMPSVVTGATINDEVYDVEDWPDELEELAAFMETLLGL